MYHSTRGKKLYSSKEALILGLAPDKGLFIPENIPHFWLSEEEMNLSYKELAKEIFKLYFEDFSDSELDEVVSLYNETNFPHKEIGISGTTDYAFLELYYGPTFAFKDMALTVLPKFIEIAKRSENKARKTVVLTATSGDTGSAALAGFSKNENNNIIVLYPEGKTSFIQEAQMLSYKNNHTFPIAIKGTFDDCQRLVKDIFKNEEFDSLDLISANSINIGRLIPQIVYYYYGYKELVDRDFILYNEKINIVVPCGNFGNILAAIIASKMGLPVNKIVCASNENNVLTDFFNSGVYDANREFLQTNSPAMDILVSSNLERLLYLIYKDTDKINEIYKEFEINHKFKIDLEDIKKEFPNLLAGFATRGETIDSINKSYKKNKILIDPHTAVGYKVYNDSLKDLGYAFSLIVSTASPYKFSHTVCEALGISGESEKERIDAIYQKSGKKIDNRLYDFLFQEHKRTSVELDEAYKYVTSLLGKLND